MEACQMALSRWPKWCSRKAFRKVDRRTWRFLAEVSGGGKGVDVQFCADRTTRASFVFSGAQRSEGANENSGRDVPSSCFANE